MRAFRSVLALLALTAVLLLMTHSPPLWSGGDRCPLLYTDYSVGCSSTDTRCGSFCLYAECVDGEDGESEHCDSEGDCWTHHIEIMPCIDWRWHLYDPGRGRTHRSDELKLTRLNELVEFGMLRPGYTPPESSCVDELNRETLLPGGVSAAPSLPGGP